MSKKHENPYKRGNYRKLMEEMRKAQIYTASFLIAKAVGFGLSESAAKSLVAVQLSSRLTSERGDCRGNCSSAGHKFYNELLARKEVDGVKEEQKYRLRYRVVALPRRTRNGEVIAVDHAEVVAVAENVEPKLETVTA